MFKAGWRSAKGMLDGDTKNVVCFNNISQAFFQFTQYFDFVLLIQLLDISRCIAMLVYYCFKLTA